MYKKLLATGSIISSLLLASGISYAQTSPIENAKPFVWHQNGGMLHALRVNALVTKLGLNMTDIQKELEGGKTFKQILDEHGITKDQLKEVFDQQKSNSALNKFRIHKKNLRHKNGNMNFRANMPSEILQAKANVLGISIDQLKQKLENKQRPVDIAKSQGMTEAQFHQKVAAQLQTMIQNGTIKGKKADFYKHVIQKNNSNVF